MNQLSSHQGNGRIVFILVAIAIFIPIVIVGIAQGDSTESVFAILIPFCIISGIVGIFVIYPAMQRMYFGKPEVAISVNEARIGEIFTMTYHHRLNRSLTVKTLAFQLILHEAATYQRGTDTVTVTHDKVVDEFGYTDQHYSRGHTIQDQWQVQIPMDGMHTFEADHNKIKWFLRVKIDTKGFFDFKRDYEIKVIPEYVH